MYDDIKKPFLLKDIPSILLRTLPSIYYYGRYFEQNSPEKTKDLFNTNVMFLSNALQHLGNKSNQKEILELAESICSLNELAKDNLFPEIEKHSTSLAKLSSKFRDELRKNVKESKTVLDGMYDKTVSKLNVLLVDNNDEPEPVSKIKKTLMNFCKYHVEISNPNGNGYSNHLVNSDFVVYASTKPAKIHDDIKALQSYNRPGLALASTNSGGITDEQSIRHGSQLMGIGIKVLYKVFTPIRLYTTIDKIYLNYYLNS